ncbi:hypothetical protein ACWDLG_20590 [Nonomuraea sp. NPDC003727]
MDEPFAAPFEKIRDPAGRKSAIQALGVIAPTPRTRNNAYVVCGISSALIFMAGVVGFLSVLNGNESLAPLAIVFAIVGIGGRIEAAVRLRP